jgi:hypothetical protein
MPDLVTLTQVQSALSQSLPADQSALPTMISAASRAAQRFCRRWFVSQPLLEIRIPQQNQWDKGQPDMVQLQQFPLIGPPRIRGGRTNALRIANLDITDNQQAWLSFVTAGDPDISLVNVGLTLNRLSSGVLTSATFPFLGTPSSAGFGSAGSGTGGSLAAGTYLCSYTVVNNAGESLRSGDVAVGIAAGQNLMFTLPIVPANANSLNVYVSTPGGSSATETLQNSTPITAPGFTLRSLVAGASPPSIGTGTIAQLAAAISALGGGWSATGQPPYANYPTTDLHGSEATMGALSSNCASLDIFSTDIANARVDMANGTIYLPAGDTAVGGGPGNVWQWPGSDDVMMGANAWRGEVLCAYNAGYSTVPEDVQEACYVIIKSLLYELQTVTKFQTESGDRFTYSLASIEERGIPAAARRLLAPWRIHRV